MRYVLLGLPWMPGGCRAVHPLSEVEIVGGSDAQVALVETELDAFETWIGPMRLSISEVRFVALSAGLAGMYRHGSRRVELNVDRPLDDLRDDLRHELCHALADEEHIGREPNAVLDSEGEDLYAYLEATALVPDHMASSAGERRREVFARFCELGPFAARMMTDGCDDTAFALMTFVQSEVWTGDTTLPSSPPPIGPAIEVDFELRERSFRVNESRTEGVVVVTAGIDSTLTIRPFEVASGEPYPEEVDLANPDRAPELLPGLEQSRGFSAPSGLAVSVATVDLLHLGRSAPRWFVHDEGWSIVDDCPTDPRITVFPASDQVWVARADGKGITWQPIRD